MPVSPLPVQQSQNVFDAKSSEWHTYGAPTIVNAVKGSPAMQTQGDSQIFWGNANDKSKMYRDVTVEGDVSVEHENVNSGLIIRANKQSSGNDWNGYFASYRRIGPEYGIVQLYRFPDFVLLQEARVQGIGETNHPVHLKVTCKGSSLWLWANDMSVPAITEFDDNDMTSGFVGLKADNNKAGFDNIVISPVGKTPRAPVVRDWSWVKGAVFITSESVNSYQMWEEYHPDVIDRELSYARDGGLNTVQVYLNFLYWQKSGATYLAHIDDFLMRASKYGLKVTFIFFDDVGNIEPPHLAPYAEPTPGIHNSQMQGSPGRDIVDNHYAEYRMQ